MTWPEAFLGVALLIFLAFMNWLIWRFRRYLLAELDAVRAELIVAEIERLDRCPASHRQGKSESPE